MIRESLVDMMSLMDNEDIEVNINTFITKPHMTIEYKGN